MKTPNIKSKPNKNWYKVLNNIHCIDDANNPVVLKPGGYCVTVHSGKIHEWDRSLTPTGAFENCLLWVGEENEIAVDTIFKHISGSQAYGTNTEKSDTDIRVIFVRPIEDYSNYFYCKEMDDFRVKYDEKTEATFYDCKKFLYLLETQNPTAIESLYCPEDCIILSSDQWDIIKKNRKKFLTKNCYNTFVRYAKTQIQKAKGQDKFQNWKKEKTERKTPIDFCMVPFGQGSITLQAWLDLRGWKQENVGLVAIDGIRYGYNMFYDMYGNVQFNGIQRDDSNDIRLSSVPKGMESVGFMSFNKDAYSIHCSNYRDYQEWLRTANPDRWVTNQEHGQQIDGKNMLHCIRLLNMADEITSSKFRVRRNKKEIAHLMDIKFGKINLTDLIKEAETIAESLEQKFIDSNLPNTCNIASELHEEILSMSLEIEFEI